MRPEDFYIPSSIVVCPVAGCMWSQPIGHRPTEVPPDLGSLLDAARDHLTTAHPTEGPEL